LLSLLVSDGAVPCPTSCRSTSGLVLPDDILHSSNPFLDSQHVSFGSLLRSENSDGG